MIYGLDDIILNKLSKLKSLIIKPKTFPVTKKIVFNSNSKKAIFLIPGWGSKPSTFFYLANKLKKDYNIIYIKHPKEVLSDNTKKTLTYYDDILKVIEESIKRLEKKGVNKFYLFGVSLGSFISFYIANKTKKIDKMIILVGGNSISESIWTSITLKEIKNKLISKNYDFKKLRHELYSIEPENNLQNIKKCRILFYTSKNDMLVKGDQQKSLVNLCKKKGINFKIKEEKIFGHYITATKNLINYRMAKRFLDD